METSTSHVIYGLVNDINKRGITARFGNGLKKLILLKDFDDSSKINELYSIGQGIAVGTNKLNRLSLKKKVI